MDQNIITGQNPDSKKHGKRQELAGQNPDCLKSDKRHSPIGQKSNHQKLEESTETGRKTVRRSKVYKGRILIGQIALLAAVLGIIEYLVRAGIVGSLYLSKPTQVAEEIYKLFAEGEIYRHLLVTLQEFSAGYLLSAFAGIATGMLLVLVPHAEAFFRPYLSALMAIPKVTIIPLLMLWLGIGLSHKVAIVFLFCFFTIAFNTITGIKQTAEAHLKVAKVFEATKLQTIFKVILPSAAPTIFVSLRVSAATGLVGALFGEMVASKDGLGNLLVQATSLYDTAKAFAIITVVTVVSVLIIAAIDLVEKRIVLRWKSST